MIKNKLNTIIICLLLVLPIAGFAFKGEKVHKGTDDNQLINFFCEQEITIDSCSNLNLYQAVYQWLGTHYKYKTKKGSGGIDCSGFTKKVYTSVYDLKLTGGSYDIFPQTKPVNKTELQEGDMVFFKIRKNRISHVGIYLGNNKFVHSAVKGGVRIDDLDEPYYKKYFFKGGRI